ncbi:helix-turn-helix transcriptional regulator [Phytoactinopolyspora halotolerans]|uniref:AraC family transcriptional regulator n=1 Tax=Phytoactinopolyspora halotolerans TaxID=1981512 RepID=A0A6L9S303_9ACTN|nr:AraC family transcriptional regulator [Phytoactinopolyspora halotolerans]NED99428.1 AraC family transcriptional regulator [Phytoactinopolyspora halotolerans]
MMTTPTLERYTRDQFLTPASQIRVLRQDLHRAGVHWHEFYEFVYVIDGTAVNTVNGVPYRLAPGSAFILTPADFHEIVTTPGELLKCYNVIIDTAALDDTLEGLVPSVHDPSGWMVDDFGEGQADFDRLWQESQQERPGRTTVMCALLQCLLIALKRRCAPAGDIERDSAQACGTDAGIRRAILYIDQHFREPLTLAGVAAQAHLSPNYFSERFHQTTGVSFQTYLQHRRLRFARSLLASTNLGVTEVCHAAGFNSLSHFGRAYRRRYGSPPSAGRSPAPHAYAEPDERPVPVALQAAG